jgi:hypothetical protein
MAAGRAERWPMLFVVILGHLRMTVTKLLIANRGEIAVRIARAAADLDLPTVAVHSQDDVRSLHLRAADEARALPGRGAPAYLDGRAIIEVAEAASCDAIHPGYGFLAERADFAKACADAGLTFIGPRRSKGVPRVARWWWDDHQGSGGWRRTGHAGGDVGRRCGVDLRAMPLRSRGSIRLRRRLR